jgi:PST family polysaccharide transporter
VVTAGYLLGLPYGSTGVAFGFSAAMTLLTVPLTIWAVKGTVVSFRDIVGAVKRPLISGIVAAVLAFTVQFFVGQSLPSIARLLLESVVLLGAFSGMLLYVMGQKAFYIDLFRTMLRRPAVQPTTVLQVQ